MGTFQMTEQILGYLTWIDAIVFLISVLTVLYIFLFAIFSWQKRKYAYPSADEPSRIAVVYIWSGDYNAFAENLEALREQTYPRQMYDVYLISTGEIDRREIDALGVELELFSEVNSDVELMKQFVERLEEMGREYDVLVLLESNNLISNNYLERINDALYAGCYAVQTHHVRIESHSIMNRIRAMSDRTNNSIFRLGHARIGLSSALLGLGMGFDYEVFCKCVKIPAELDLEKHIECNLLKNGYYIEYLEDVYTIRNESSIKDQGYKHQMTSSQIKIAAKNQAVKDALSTILFMRWDYANKLFQWILPSRKALILLNLLFASVVTFLDPYLGLKWWLLLLLLVITLVIARGPFSKKLPL